MDAEKSGESDGVSQQLDGVLSIFNLQLSEPIAVSN